MRVVGRVLTVLALVVVLLGVSVQLLLAPAFTRTLSSRVSQAEEAGLGQSRALAAAEQVRAFVAAPSATATLPAQVDGVPGFDAAAVSHLRDVALVLSRARLLTALAGGVVVLWLAVLIIRGRVAQAAADMRAGAVVSALIVAVAGVAAVTSFDWFFTAFHGLFFAEGTWTFPADSLLIRLFPETFWITAGVAWAVLVLVGSGLLWLTAGWLERSTAAREAVVSSNEGA